MYKDKSSGALKPGSKGISLTAEQVGVFFFAFLIESFKSTLLIRMIIVGDTEE